MHIYNSLSKQKEEFTPQDGKTVRFYVCGPTVYDFSHIGHARVYVVWDVIQRYLRYKGYKITYVRNVTDIDDKIINKAKEEGIRPEQVARKYLYEFWRDMEALNTQPPDVEPRATEFVPQMIEFIKGLIGKGKAYEAGGDVYFDVKSASKYGRLTKQNLNEMESGSRDQVLSQEELKERKRHPADFALWKGTDKSESGWPSPWGHGRPGWHLECSTMIKHVLGETIDMHGGGEDLLFPHHENEIAQTEGLENKPLARFWVHNSFVQVNSEKMSKSLGNFTTIRELLKNYSADELRLFILQTHYRNPIDFSVDALQAAKTGMQRLIRAVYGDGSSSANGRDAVPPQVMPSKGKLTHQLLKGDASLEQEKTQIENEFVEALDDDFNTAKAVAFLFKLSDLIGTAKDKANKEFFVQALKDYAAVLGFTLLDTRKLLPKETTSQLMDLILSLRSESKQRKDYATSDLIRKRLAECGVNVMDTADGATWENSG
ncbi:MAG: cysteine--tRNA ligase [Candidatus Melainabacteria bacterium]|nr:MAG: cysteine--tRNA ligase [Candidatus Melainabacteria bacterium]